MAIYLDNAATSFPKPESVYEAVNNFQREIGGNPGRSTHRFARIAKRKVLETRKKIARLCNIQDPSRVIFTANGTEALNLAIKGVLRPGDHVITSFFEHNSVNRPLTKLISQGVSVTWIPANLEYGLDLNELSRKIQKNSRMIVLIHSSNVLGTLFPISEVGAIARENGLIFLVDGAQTVGKLPIDVEAMNIDLLAAPGHKGLFGPQGTGFLYLREGVLMETLKEGGTGSRSDLPRQPEFLPDRFESGTLNGPGIAGLGAGVEFILQEGQEKISQKEKTLLLQLWEGLEKIPRVKVYGPPPSLPRATLVSFNIEGLHCEDVGFILDNVFQIAVRSGLHCAPGIHKIIGTFPEGTVRVSPGYFNIEKDIEAFIAAVEDIVKR